MEVQELFLRKFAALAVRSDREEEFSLLETAGLLRQLLADGDSSLAAQANRDPETARPLVEIRFVAVVDEPQEMAAGAVWVRGDGLDSHAHPTFPDESVLQRLPEELRERLKRTNVNPAELKLKQFLRVAMMVTRESKITVLDLIKDAANVKGGIHHGKPSTDTQKDLARINSWVLKGPQGDIGNHSLLSIARVVVRALAPLAEEIRRRRPDLPAK